ncbi:helix-turn-helix transcriptional regulator [Streptomyces sp. NPDC049954]|uniref:helix-turn-helix domain-containing protein n=1 Tax=Streptomyces sp. NPDC049954 TaxID=3155779 RepID=UPI0034409CFC
MSTDEEFKILTWEYFGEELKRARMAAGLTQSGLGGLVFVSASYIAQFETGQRKPQLDVAERIDQVLGTGGMLHRLVRKLVILADRPAREAQDKALYQARYFAHTEALEHLATTIDDFAPILVPGLLQTPGYIRAIVLAARPFATEEYIEGQITGRAVRQEILKDATRPQYWVVLHEHVLRLPVGSDTVMEGQLQHIADLASRGEIGLQVLPVSEGAHAAMGAMLTLMTFEDTPPVGYTETAFSGTLIDDPYKVSRAQEAYGLLRSVALSPAVSLDVVSSVAADFGRRARKA